MAEAQDNLTPEEKLLKVIQSGGEQTFTPEQKLVEAVARPAVQEVALAVEEPALLEVKPALKLAPQPAAAAKAKKSASPVVTSEASSPAEVNAAEAGAEAPVVMFAKKKSGGGSGLKTVNGMLVAGILIMLSLSGFETFQMIRAYGLETASEVLEMPEAKEITLTVDEVQQAYGQGIWYIAPDAAAIASPNPNETDGVPRTPWGDYMRQNIKLMGVSWLPEKTGSEAILMDSKIQKMYFVRFGNSFTVEGVDVRLDDLEQERARFTDGRISIELK